MLAVTRFEQDPLNLGPNVGTLGVYTFQHHHESFKATDFTFTLPLNYIFSCPVHLNAIL